MMRHLGLLGHGRLCSTDIHVSVDLARINVDDLSIKRLRNGQRKSRFAHRSGTDYHQERLLHWENCLYAQCIERLPRSSALYPMHFLDTLESVDRKGHEAVQHAGYCSSTISRSSLPGLKNGTRFAGICTVSPVLGLRPSRGLRLRIRKLPKPRNSTLSPSLSASVIQVSIMLTTASVCFLVS